MSTINSLKQKKSYRVVDNFCEWKNMCTRVWLRYRVTPNQLQVVCYKNKYTLLVENTFIWYLECEMGFSRHKCLNPARALKARAGFGHECRENPSRMANNVICIFSHACQHKNMQQSKTCPCERKYVHNLWRVMWRIPRYDFPGIVHIIAPYHCWSVRRPYRTWNSRLKGIIFC